MAITRDTISNFIGGVSQQTDKLMYPYQSKALENFLLDPIEGLKKRPPSEFVAKLHTPLTLTPYIHTIIKEDEEYQVLLTGTGIKVFDLKGNEKSVYISGDADDYITTSNPLKDLYAVTIADYTFILNKTKTAQLKDTTYINNYANSAIIFVKQGDYGTNYNITINGNSVSFTTSETEVDQIRTDYIAGQLTTELQDTLGSEDFTITRLGSTILITSSLTTGLMVQVTDGNGDRNLFSFYKETSCLNDLPVTAPDGFILKIIGDDISVADDYYVKFQTADGSSFGTGAWVECPQPAIKYQIDPATMPHALIREASGNFTLKALDWTDRKAGDENTAPTPSFIGQKIQEILTYKSRLGLIAGDRSCYSDVEDIFSFFKRSVLTELDTDPIDVGSNSKMVLLKHSIPFNEGLMLFSENSQFTLAGGDLFSNSTVSLDLTTEYQCSKDCKPVISGANGYFVYENGSFTKVMSLYVTSSYTIDASDVTAQIPSYIPSGVYKLAASQANNILAVLSEKTPDCLYIYNSYSSGEERIQSAWHKWVFKDAKILNIDFNKHLLYLTVQYTDGIYLEKIDLTPKKSESDLDYLFYIDRKIYHTLVTYDEDNDTTEIELPYKVEDETTLRILDNKGFTKVFTIDETKTKLTIKGEYTDLITGQVYLTYWHLPKIYVRQNTSNGGLKVREGILMLRDINLTYAQTGYFKVNINSKYTTQINSSFKFTGIVCGRDTATLGKIPVESGTFLIPVISNNEDIEITIENDSYLPCCFLSLEWLGDFTYRGR